MKNKNRHYLTNGNDAIDDLLFTVENLNLFSESFQRKITNIALWILTNHKNHEEEIKIEINNLHSLMKSLKIFDTLFIKNIFILLQKGLEFEMNREKSHV